MHDTVAHAAILRGPERARVCYSYRPVWDSYDVAEMKIAMTVKANGAGLNKTDRLH